MSGLSDEGFEARTPQEFFDLMREEFERRTGETLEVERSNVVLHILVVVASILGDLSGSLQAIYDARDVNNASGLQLDALAALVGINRRPPQPARIAYQRFEGDINTTAPAGKEVEGGGPDGSLRWELQEDVKTGEGRRVTTAASGSWEIDVSIPSAGVTQTVTYNATSSDTEQDIARGWRDKINANTGLEALDARAINTAGDAQAATLYVTSPKGLDFSISSSNIPGTNSVYGTPIGWGQIEAKEPGAVSAPTGSIDTIVTPVQGIDATRNDAPPTGGADRESDPELRLRIPRSFALRGSATKAAIRATLLDVDVVTAAVVVENDKDLTQTIEGIELPPHSVGLVVFPSVSGLIDEELDEVAARAYETVAAGIEIAEDATNFASSERATRTVEAADGTSKDVTIHSASGLPVSVTYDITLEPGYSNPDVVPMLKNQTSEYLKTRQVGGGAFRLDLYGIADDIEGIESVTTLELNGSASDVTPDATRVVTNDGVNVNVV